MRLSNYLLEEEDTGRSKNISKEKALRLVYDNCSKALGQYLKNESFIYRDFDYESQRYLYVEPSKHTRISRNTYNYYTLIMDNSPLWKEYPKRSKSIICGTTGVSSQYTVFPFDGSKIGVCPSFDLWDSFDSTLIDDLETFTESLSSIFKIYDLGVKDNNIQEFKEALKVIDKEKDKSLKDDVFDYFGEDDFYTRDLLNAYKDSKKPFWDFLELLFNPKKNGFRLKKIGDKLPDEREVWTDGNSVLVQSKYYSSFMTDINYALNREDK